MEDNISHIEALMIQTCDMAVELDLPKSVSHEITHKKLGYE